ncbi:hypothetical protein H4K36_00095 [Streptomyces sp. DHE7-1]|nr:hypothetical protein [Streptomyces sp. DHE7-1]
MDGRQALGLVCAGTLGWTLLRGALENFATGLWLLDGTGCSERRRRALSLWDEYMRNRQQHETDTGHLPSGGGLTGAQRRTEIRAIADQLGLAPLTACSPPHRPPV